VVHAEFLIFQDEDTGEDEEDVDEEEDSERRAEAKSNKSNWVEARSNWHRKREFFPSALTLKKAFNYAVFQKKRKRKIVFLLRKTGNSS
jgi:hypothetical protein